MQIIIEQEDKGEPLFSSQSLSQLIRFYGDSVQSEASDYLQKSINLFVSEKKQEQEYLSKNLTPPSSLTDKDEEDEL